MAATFVAFVPTKQKETKHNRKEWENGRKRKEK